MSETIQSSPQPQLVVPSQSALISAAMVLLNRELGEGMYSFSALHKTAAGPGSAIHVVREGEELAAAAVTRMLAAEDVDYYERFGRIATDLFSRHRVGSLEALAVEPRWRRRGLGRALALARIRWIAGQGGDAAAGAAWISGRPDSSEPLYRSLGFEFSDRIPDFYLEESLRDGWICPVDGGPCHCPAAFFYRLIR